MRRVRPNCFIISEICLKQNLGMTKYLKNHAKFCYVGVFNRSWKQQIKDQVEYWSLWVTSVQPCLSFILKKLYVILKVKCQYVLKLHNLIITASRLWVKILQFRTQSLYQGKTQSPNIIYFSLYWGSLSWNCCNWDSAVTLLAQENYFCYIGASPETRLVVKKTVEINLLV